MTEEDLTQALSSRERFLPVLDYFVNKSIKECYSEAEDQVEISYASFYEKFLSGMAERSADIIYQYSQSPIEKIFLSSFLLLFIKSGMPCLHITPPLADVEEEIEVIRENYNLVMSLIDSYKEASGDLELKFFEQALSTKLQAGDFTEDEIMKIRVYNSIVKHFEWNSYHLTLQAGFPKLKVNGRAIRCDILIWVPGDESVKIVVECDGFAFHNSRSSFANDRARDRVLQMNGYRVIRFSGSEINQNPAKVSSELFDLLQALDSDLEGNRVL